MPNMGNSNFQEERVGITKQSEQGKNYGGGSDSPSATTVA